jgi:pimeloyl-ACP methyl ester carboxylesterase
MHQRHSQEKFWAAPESSPASRGASVQIRRKSATVDGLITSYLEAGQGDPVVLLHGGEFGASAELGWERTIGAIAEDHRVLAPDLLGFGESAKVIDFTDGRGIRIRHVARFCEVLGIESAHFVGNSMGAIMLLTDATSAKPLLPVRTLVAICGGGDILRSPHMDALYDYDATLPGMRRILEALFHDPCYPADDDYVQRRYDSSVAPGAWEAVAAARFRRRTRAGADSAQHTRIRAHRGSGARHRRRLRQIAARWVGPPHRRPDPRRSVGGGERRRSLPSN